jgi:Nucleotidyltransferase domain
LPEPRSATSGGSLACVPSERASQRGVLLNELADLLRISPPSFETSSPTRCSFERRSRIVGGRTLFGVQDLASSIPALLRANPFVSTVELCGSRASGTAGRFSDWDFCVTTRNFDALAPTLSALVRPLVPLAEQWDRLSDYACYMLILSGPTKIDLIFADVPHEDEPSWLVDVGTLRRIDDHFWDWSLWLTSKVDAGKDTLVAAELRKMHLHLLAPMGIPTSPASLEDAVEKYLPARDACAQSFGVSVDHRLEHEIVPIVKAAGRD